MNRADQLRALVAEAKAPQAQQPAVEPVAEMSHKFGRPVLLPRAPMLDDKQPLYTSPTPPADVPLLTDEEIAQIASVSGKMLRDYAIGKSNEKPTIFARALEAAVRQKAGLK